MSEEAKPKYFAGYKDVTSEALAEHEGRKDDAGKPRWDLVQPLALTEYVKVLTHGAEIYGAHNWRQVTEPRRRYFAAAMRHTFAWWKGEKTDAKSGLPHLAHAMCCLAFLLELEMEGESK